MIRVMVELKYGGKLMASWVHLLAPIVLALALAEAVPGGGPTDASMDMGADAGRWVLLCMRMAEVYLPVLAPVFAASVLAPEQLHGWGELAATWPGSLRRTVAGRLVAIIVALAVPTAATIAWAVRTTGGELTAWELVKAVAPTMWALIGATVLGAVIGGVAAGFGAGFGWWALDRLTGGTVTRQLYLFGATWC
ncbi:MAG: hypothetical protein VB144_05590 [Clostridia bacterium]|nr:hypothetical protein [Clostridia bacterium]